MISEAITTVYPTRDWVISDFVVTDPDFGAKAEPGFDNSAAFQAAINAAYDSGGGVVYIPAGNYEFHSVQTGVKSVRVRKGSAEETGNYSYEYVLQLLPGVQLRGDRADPALHGGKVLGTILEVYAGEDSPNSNASVESWWNDSQAGNALRTTFTSIADRFIEMREGTGVTNLSVWYPRQDIHAIKPYPWTLYQASGNSATVENVTLVNAYNGFYSAPSELHYVLNSCMTALRTGIEVHVCTDIGRIENVHISPTCWAGSGLPGSPTPEEVTACTKAGGTGFRMHRSDWEYVSRLHISGYETGMWIGREPGFADAPNAQFYGIDIDDCGVGLYVQDVNPYGLLFTGSTFGAGGDGPAVYFHNSFRSSVQFNGTDFHGAVVSDGSGGVISFGDCTFDRYRTHALKINGGNILLTQCRFAQPEGHLQLNTDVNMLKAINSGHNGVLKVDNRSRNARIESLTDDRYRFDPLPKDIKTGIAIHPKPQSNSVLRVELPKAAGFNNDRPTTDVSAKLQAALNAVKAAGGGTVYLPAGRYLVEKPLTIPTGVELRGNWDVQHHTQSGGTALFTNYAGGDKGEKGAPLIQLEAKAGISGFTIAQLNIATDGFSPAAPRRTPFLIQGRGKGIYIVNITVSGGDKGIDLASFNTGGHYVDYFAGVLARAGIRVGGGAEGGIIRNTQFNPHYGTRLPRGGQGYPGVTLGRFVQANCSALQFADVKSQTIFNNFVYGSVYGIHFLKDAVTGSNPGEMTVIGHGSDGCTYALFVENADPKTKIVAVNSELVNTQIQGQPVRSYILMGDRANTAKVHPDAQLILYNSAFWGSPVTGAIINSGTVRIIQANFQRTGIPGIDVRGGKAHVSSSYFAQKMTEDTAGHGGVYGKLHATGSLMELTNNYYASGLKIDSEKPDGILGPDVAANPPE
jgi:hypothetical protein